VTSLRAGIIQSNYVPWRGYFDFMASVDVFVIYDDVQYSTGSWRNRNQLKTADGLKWMTVPVKKKLGLAIDETEVEYAHPWMEQHRGLLKASLGKCPFFRDASDLWERGVSGRGRTISELNVALIREICAYLHIETPLRFSRDYTLSGVKTERLIQLLRQVGATTYVSGPAAKDYLEHDRFRSEGIRLEYKSYDYEPYAQPFGEFAGAVSILDLIANRGPDAVQLLRSRSPNEVAVA
jgi:hypothetical protein